jgi:hypothetical protein
MHLRTIFAALLILAVSLVLMESSGAPVARSHSTGTAHLEIDFDPSTGSGPCDIVETTVDVDVDEVFDVAICIGDAQSAPVSGTLAGVQIQMPYGSALTGINVASDLSTDLEGNPNWNQGPELGGTDWDCNVTNTPGPAPRGAPSPAHIFCRTLDLMDNSIAGTQVHLATFSLQAADSGEEALNFDSNSIINNSIGVGAHVCGTHIACYGGTVLVDGPSHLELDFDPTNGSGPCDIVDATVEVEEGEEFDVFICLEEAQSAPVSGALGGLEIYVSYPSGLTGINVPSDLSTDLQGNPNLNEGPELGGTDWDCNLVNNPATAPLGSPSPAQLICTTLDTMENSITDDEVRLAAFSLQAGTAGEVAMDFASNTLVWNGVVETYTCGAEIECIGGTVTVTEPPEARLALDMDPTNGSGPCDVVDTFVEAYEAEVRDMAICIVGAQLAPVSGTITSAGIYLDYSGGMTGLNVGSDLNLDLNSNPNWNEGPTLGGSDWDCNLLNHPAAAPLGAPTPAQIFCTTNDAMPNPILGTNAHLATFSFQATDPAAIAIPSPSSLANHVGELSCEVDIVCSGGSVQVVPAPSSFSVDTEPSNGSRPCDPLDPSRAVSIGDTYQVAICGEGNPSAFSLSLDYDSGQADATDDAGTGPANLDGNPDLNDGAGPGHVGSSWDCSIGGVNQPSGADPATLNCAGTGELGVSRGHLATVEFTAVGAGVQQMRFVAASTTLDGEACAPLGVLPCASATIHTLPPPPLDCEVTLTGTFGETSPGEYAAPVNGPLQAHGRIPASEGDLLLRVKRPDSSVIVEQSITGAPGDPLTLGFTASPPGPLTVECVVDNVVDSTATVTLILIDPSGRVYDAATSGSLAGATVELQVDSDVGAGEGWLPLSAVTHAGFFEPAINPETTGLDGRYAWDVAPYYPEGVPDPTNNYRVVVSAPGCTPATSAVVTVPPPALDLDVGLTCLDSDSDGLSNEHEVALLGTDPSSADTDGNGTTDDDEDADGDTLINSLEVNQLNTNPLSADSDGDAAADGDEVAQGTSPLVADTDGDGFKDLQPAAHLAVNVDDAVDNCGLVANPGQQNSDALVDNGPGVPGDDLTRPASDGLGDACDDDGDNDGLPDAEDIEPLGATGVCAAFADSSDGHGAAADGDVGYSDGTPTSWDTDGDAVPDGRECIVGTNPRVNDSAHRSMCAATTGTGDGDGDGLQDPWEVCGWGSLATGAGSTNSDGDGLGDCREVMDVNGSGVVNNNDAVFVKQHFFGLIVGDRAAMDVNRSATVNNNDSVFIQQAFFAVNPCV